MSSELAPAVVFRIVDELIELLLDSLLLLLLRQSFILKGQADPKLLGILCTEVEAHVLFVIPDGQFYPSVLSGIQAGAETTDVCIQ